MEEKTKQELERDRAEQKAIEKENKLLSIVLPIVGAIALIIGALGFALTISSGQVAITVFFAIMIVLGLVGAFFGVVLLIRIKKPNFLKKKKEEEVKEDILPD